MDAQQVENQAAECGCTKLPGRVFFRQLWKEKTLKVTLKEQ